MNESESFFTVQREIRLRGISPKFSPTEAAALLSGLEPAVCSDGWDRTVSGYEPASPCLLVFVAKKKNGSAWPPAATVTAVNL